MAIHVISTHGRFLQFWKILHALNLLYTFKLYNYKAQNVSLCTHQLNPVFLADVLTARETGPVDDTDDDKSDVNIDTIPEVQTLKGIH